MTDRTSSSRDPLALLDDYDFELPEASIAQTALPERDAARLLVVHREDGRLANSDADPRVRDLVDYLGPNDLLIVNVTRVLSARLVGQKSTGGAAEALLLERDEAEATAPLDALAPSGAPWAEGPAFRALLKSTGRVRPGLELRLGRAPGVAARVEALFERGEVRLRFEAGADPYSLGEAPLPPYIRRGRDDASQGEADLSRYQTIFAREPGAVAAPTAGLHFTPELFERLAAAGVRRAEVVLHVGAGTFRPLDRESLESGRLHSEHYELPAETVEAIEQTRKRGGRVVAVGTTTVRVLESCADETGKLLAGKGDTRLFIRPGGSPFRVVDALLTNFHLPRSSLLLLVAAFVGRVPLLEAYRFAIEQGYRFYSYGDAMLIVPGLGAGSPNAKMTSPPSA